MLPSLLRPLFRKNPPRILGASASASKALLKFASAPRANSIVSSRLPKQNTHNSLLSTNPKEPTSGTTLAKRFRSSSKLLNPRPFSKSPLSPLASPHFSNSCRSSPTVLLFRMPLSPGPAGYSTLLFSLTLAIQRSSSASAKPPLTSFLSAPLKAPPLLSLGAQPLSSAASTSGDHLAPTSPSCAASNPPSTPKTFSPPADSFLPESRAPCCRKEIGQRALRCQCYSLERANRPPQFPEVRSRLGNGVRLRFFKFAGSK